MDEQGRQFLPPQPAGPEPELGARPAPPAPPAPAPTYGGWQPPQPPPGWAHPPQATQPDNGAAVAGFVLSVVSGGLLLISFGFSSIVSVICSILGMVYSRLGKRKVEAGETTKHAGLAQAGWIVGIVGLVLALLATAAWAALLTDDDVRRDFENEFDDSNSIRAFVQIGAGVGRLLLA
jgi:hypothetical protein